MTIKIIVLILLVALVTACISGIFGMAGGLIFMGVIASFMGVAEAMVVHGAVQGVSNSYRAYLLRGHVRWDIFGKIVVGAVPALALLFLLRYVPSKGVLFMVLGLLPVLLWLPKGWISLDAQKPAHAIFCGFCVTGLNLVAGVAGPALDMFFVKTQMPRHEIVATKAIIMFTSHIMKILYFGIPLLMRAKLSGQVSGLPPWWFFIAAVPLIILGTFTGTRILGHMSNVGFRSTTKYLVSVVGVFYVFRGAVFLGWI